MVHLETPWNHWLMSALPFWIFVSVSGQYNFLYTSRNIYFVLFSPSGKSGVLATQKGSNLDHALAELRARHGMHSSVFFIIPLNSLTLDVLVLLKLYIEKWADPTLCDEGYHWHRARKFTFTNVLYPLEKFVSRY